MQDLCKSQTARTRRDFSGASTEVLESASRGLLANIRTLEGSDYDTGRLKDGLADIESELIERLIEEGRQSQVRNNPPQDCAYPLQFTRLGRGFVFYGTEA